MNDRYLTVKEVSKIIGVTPLTLRNWDRKGLLTAFRNPVNNYRLYRYADIAAFVDEIRKSGSREPAPENVEAVVVSEQPKVLKLPVRFEEDVSPDLV